MNAFKNMKEYLGQVVTLKQSYSPMILVVDLSPIRISLVISEEDDESKRYPILIWGEGAQ